MSRDTRGDESGARATSPGRATSRLSAPSGAVAGRRRRGRRRRGVCRVARSRHCRPSRSCAGLGEPTPPELRIDPQPVDCRDLQARRRIGAAAHVYEVTGTARRPIYVTEPFGGAARPVARAAPHATSARRPTRSAPTAPGSRGSATSWHSSGEAIDIARLRADGTRPHVAAPRPVARRPGPRAAPSPRALLAHRGRVAPRVRRRADLSLRRRARATTSTSTSAGSGRSSRASSAGPTPRCRPSRRCAGTSGVAPTWRSPATSTT